MAAAAFLWVSFVPAAAADPIGWAQPNGPGSPVRLTYSYSNLLDGGFNTYLSSAELKYLTELAFGVWARYVPVYIVEVKDTGPTPISIDREYDPRTTADIRIGYAESVEGNLAHTHVPFDRDEYAASGLGGDIHFWNEPQWGRTIESALAVDFFSVMLHEAGHALGLLHIFGVPAIMSGSLLQLELIPERADLRRADIDAIRRLYGVGIGSVTPLIPTPEPASALLLAAGALAALARRRGLARAARVSA